MKVFGVLILLQMSKTIDCIYSNSNSFTNVSQSFMIMRFAVINPLHFNNNEHDYFV
jgi:hypothetical protein